jgi:hypothetical protein
VEVAWNAKVFFLCSQSLHASRKIPMTSRVCVSTASQANTLAYTSGHRLCCCYLLGWLVVTKMSLLNYDLMAVIVFGAVLLWF